MSISISKIICASCSTLITRAASKSTFVRGRIVIHSLYRRAISHQESQASIVFAIFSITKYFD